MPRGNGYYPVVGKRLKRGQRRLVSCVHGVLSGTSREPPAERLRVDTVVPYLPRKNPPNESTPARLTTHGGRHAREFRLPRKKILNTPSCAVVCSRLQSCVVDF
jgi:hypothetical protein